MKIEQGIYTEQNGWEFPSIQKTSNPNFVLVFAASNLFKDSTWFEPLQKRYPEGKFIGCSTSGEISGNTVRDQSAVATAVEFSHAQVRFAQKDLKTTEDSYECGKSLIEQFPTNDLKHVLVFSDGLHINGSELVRGMRQSLPKGVTVTGGLAGDGPNFKQTYVITQNGKAQDNCVCAIGLYGDSIGVGYGSYSGWDPFGVERLVSKSKSNVLYEIDNQPALELYKSFLGDNAAQLPASGLLFPLSLRTKEDEQPVVRTILSVNELDQSITFAGDLPEGSYVRLMKANTDRLIQGAVKAAEISKVGLAGNTAALAIMVSCVGRKLVLKQLVEEEIEGANELIGNQCVTTGLYSYGEISPFSENRACELHNQTMTITTLFEKE
jgi:hypothetical protein